MNFEWDNAKNQSNLLKHGIDFEAAVAIFDDFVYTLQDMRADYGENRFVSFGLLEGLEITVIYAKRDSRKRIISARRSRQAERKKYYDELAKFQNRLSETGGDER